MKKLLLSIICCLLFSGTAFSQCFVSFYSQPDDCDSSCTGIFDATYGGGTIPFSISINNTSYGQFTSTFHIENLCPGNYVVIVTDAAGDTCMGSSGFTIYTWPSPSSTVSVSNASCPTCNDGSATVTTTGGMFPITYLWSQGSTGPNIQNLSPGIYTVTTTAADGCMDVDTFLIGVNSTGMYSLSGVCYFDQNQNGIKDFGEVGLSGKSVSIAPGSITAITDQNGEYEFVAYPGIWDISNQLNSGWNLTSSPSTYNVNLTGVSITSLDFGLYPISNAGSGYTNTNSDWPRCFWDVQFYPSFVNDGYTFLNGSLTFTHDPLQSFVSSSLVPDLVSGNSYTFNFSNLPPGQKISPVITLLESAGGAITNCTTSATVSDSYGFSGSYTHNFPQQITCSFDPNDKNVDPAGVGASHFVEMDSWLNYQIRFQNTGTDTAITVVIIDTLDAALDRSTLSITGSSHPVNVTYNSSGEVTFRFNNILLPDSNINEPASHGYVSYRIKGLASNPDPTPVNNTAYIYFDLNSPVVTNSTLTTLSDNLLGLHNETGTDNWFSLFPNPSSGDVIVKLNSDKTGDYNMIIFDAAGRLVIQKELKGQDHLSVKTEWLTPGIYIIELKSNDTGAKAHKKLIRY